MIASWRRAVAFALGVLAVDAAAPRVLAQTPGVATSRRVVLVAYRGERDEALERTVRELLARRDLEGLPADQETAVSSRVLVRVEIDRGADGTRVLVRPADASGAALLDRLVPHDANPAIERERIGLAVRGAAEAALVMEEERRAPPPPAPETAPEATPALPPPPPPEPAPEPVATPTPPPPEPDRAPKPAGAKLPFGIDIATFAGAGAVGNGAGAVARVGGGLGIGLRRGLRPSVAIDALYAVPFDNGGGAVITHAHLVSVRVLPAIEPIHGSRLAVAFALGGGVDVLRVDPSSETLPDSVLGTTTTRVDPIVTGAVTGRLGIASDVVLTLSLVGDVDLVTRRYVFDNRGTRASVFEPWNVRPMLLAGLAFTAAGPQPFAGSR